MIVLQCINMCPVAKIQRSSAFTPAYLQDMYQNMFQFSTFNRFDQIVIGKHFKCFFIEFFILCHQHNRDIMSFQAHCPYSFQTPALITIQPQKYQIADLVSLCQSFQKTLSGPIQKELCIRDQCGKLPVQLLCILSYFITYRDRHHCHCRVFLPHALSDINILFSKKDLRNMCF